VTSCTRPEFGASAGPDIALAPGNVAEPNANDEPRGGKALIPWATPVRARTDTSADTLRRPELGVTPILPAIAESRSSISTGILGGAGFGRSSAPSVVLASDGLLDGGNTTEGRAEVLATGVGTGPARGGGRGRGAHPVRRGRGLTAGLGEDTYGPDEEGDGVLCRDPLDIAGGEGDAIVTGIVREAKLVDMDGGIADD
jgi:hypothetical protein